MSATDMTATSALQDLGEEPDERTDGLDGYAVKLAVFEGPLDLLLHLIRQNEVDITDIPIARIAGQISTRSSSWKSSISMLPPNISSWPPLWP